MPDGRKVKLPKIPLRLNENDFDLRTNPPEIGQHTTELLLELGYSAPEIERLQDKEIIR